MLHTLPTPPSVQLANKPPRINHHRNLTLRQIKNMDSIFSIPEEVSQEEITHPPLPKKKLPFLDLPPELRNQIYFLVFAPAAPGMRLFPSIENLNSLSFLHTCHQIHTEARTLAYALSYTTTNRWHRQDLLQMSHYYNSLPSMLSTPIKTLQLETQWRLPHQDPKTGHLEFFDSFTDWAWWIWDCLELFSAVQTLKIMHTWRPKIDGLTRLQHCFAIDVDGPQPGYRSTHISEPKKWSVVRQVDGQDRKPEKLFLVGLQERRGRKVEVECVAVETGFGKV